MKEVKNQKKLVVLKGEGANQHVLVGEFDCSDKAPAIGSRIEVKDDTILRHETPTGGHAEHMGLQVGKGTWYVGSQIEYDPFRRQWASVWD